jgi:hypothetical protein
MIRFSLNRRRVLWATLLLSVFAICIGRGVYKCLLGWLTTPPRPMFHNYYGPHPDRGLCNQWFPTIPHQDSDGTQVWADYDDNLLVVLLRSVPPEESSRSAELISGVDHSSLKIGPDARNSYVIVQRKKNKLLAIANTGETMEYALEEGKARSFDLGASDVRTRGGSFISLLSEIIDRSERDRFESFARSALSSHD